MEEPVISIITPYYNSGRYIVDTAKSVLSQTFSLFEWIIIDDGSSKDDIDKLKKIEKLDKRIKVVLSNKSNPEGPAVSRDNGVKNSAKSSKYIVFLDSDDIYDKTFLECSYWTLETHPDASWTYTDSVNFGAKNFLWRKWFNVEWEKEENLLLVSSCIRKKDFLDVGGFETKEKGIYEDWYLWLKLIKAGKYPIRMNSLLTYYRQKKEESELKKANLTNRKKAMDLIKNIKRDIVYYEDAVQFPKFDYDWNLLQDEAKFLKDIKMIRKAESPKINILMIIPWMITGGADKFNLNLISRLNPEKFEFTIITTLPAKNEWRENFEKYATIYDLTTFLDMKDWLGFINYIIEKNSINLIFNSNSEFGYKILPYLKARNPEIPIVDYVHMEEWYWKNGGFSRDSSIVSNVIDKTFTCNENSRQILIKHFDRKPRETKTIYIGTDILENKEKSGEKLTLKNAKDADKKYIGFICRMVEQKRPYLFLEVCKKLYETEKNLKVIVAGDGPMLTGFKKKVKDNNLEEIFEFKGKVQNPKDIYEMCDITVNTSIKEGVALTTYESLALGVPVVASDVGGQKEVITEDVGIVVPCMQTEKDIFNFNYSDEEIQNYVNAIQKVFSKINYYKSNCKKKIENEFTTDNMAKELEKELINIVTKPNKEKTMNGKLLQENIEITKELISTYFMASENEYSWMCDEFNKNNVHIMTSYDNKKGKKQYYEHTLEYKIKHPIVVILRKVGIYDNIRKFI